MLIGPATQRGPSMGRSFLLIEIKTPAVEGMRGAGRYYPVPSCTSCTWPEDSRTPIQNINPYIIYYYITRIIIIVLSLLSN